MAGHRATVVRAVRAARLHMHARRLTLLLAAVAARCCCSRTPTQAVIGAGPAGLAVCRELLREGHAVTVFEASADVGGSWQVADAADSDLLARDPRRMRVHGSMCAPGSGLA